MITTKECKRTTKHAIHAHGSKVVPMTCEIKHLRTQLAIVAAKGDVSIARYIRYSAFTIGFCVGSAALTAT